jgi:hypothetical protein
MLSQLPLLTAELVLAAEVHRLKAEPAPRRRTRRIFVFDAP